MALWNGPGIASKLVGSLGSLKTAAKENVVVAINELFDKISTHQSYGSIMDEPTASDSYGTIMD